jgi:hypothetical protein
VGQSNKSTLLMSGIFNIQLVFFIIKTAVCTAGFLIGLYFLLVSKEKWEGLLEKLTATKDVEVSGSTMVGLKLFGIVLLLLDGGVVYAFFL